MPIKIRKSIQSYLDVGPEELNAMTRDQLLNALDDLRFYSKRRQERFESSYSIFQEKYPSVPLPQAYTDKSPIRLAIMDTEKLSEKTTGALRHQFRLHTEFLSTKTSTFGGYMKNIAKIKKSFFDYANDSGTRLRLTTAQIDKFFKIYKGISHTAEEVAAGGKYEVWRLIKEMLDRTNGVDVNELREYLENNDMTISEGDQSTLLRKLINFEVAGKDDLSEQEKELLKLYGYSIEGFE